MKFYLICNSRIDNNIFIASFKIWHYTGGLLFEHNVQSPSELWEATWQPMPDNYVKEFKVSTKKVAGIKPSQPQGTKTILCWMV